MLLGQNLLLNLELDEPARLANQRAPWIRLSLLPQYWDSRHMPRLLTWMLAQ